MNIVHRCTAVTRQHGQACVAPLVIEMLWAEEDPHAVSMTFPTRPKQAPWVFARDLLAQGLDEEVGEGDVHCGAYIHNYTITLFGHGKESDMVLGLVVETTWVEQFLQATTHGGDFNDSRLDLVLADILGGEAA